jgi:VWFA-related protein
MKKMAAFALVSLMLCAGPASFSVRAFAQVAAKPQATLKYDVSVILKLIQVYVTDKKGVPVPDLTLQDFTLTDNGRPMTLTEFERHVMGPPEGKAAPAAGTVTRGPVPEPPRLSRKFFLFFDFTYNNQRGILKSRKAALHFLETKVRPEDEVALVSFSMIKGVAFHEYLTTDHRKIRDAVSAVNGKAIAGRAEDIEQEYWSTAVEALPMVGDLSGPLQRNPVYFNWRRQESKDVVLSYIRRLTDLAKALRLVPGQKHFIFFSSGIPASMIYGNQVGSPAQARQAQKFDMGDHVLRTANENMLKEFGASNCAVYAFDTRESAKVPSLFDYEERTFATNIRNIFSDLGAFQSVTEQFRDDKTTGLDSLKRLSDITGGKYFGNINLYERNLAQVQNLTGAYYILGYAIGAEWDGRYHEVKVEVNRKGCEVRAQAGYFNPKPFRECSELEKQLQLFDLALNERSDLQAPKSLPLAVLSYDAGLGARLEVVSRLTASALEDSSGKNVEFVSVIFDGRGNLADLQRTCCDLTRQPGHEFLFSAGVSVAPGDYTCRLVVRDLETGASAVGSGTVRVAARATNGLALHSPLLLAPDSRTAYLDAAGAVKAGVPGWRDVYAFDRSRYGPLIGNLAPGTPGILAVVPYSVARLADPKVTLSAYLINAGTGERLPVSFYLQGRSRLGASEAQLLEFSLDRVPPGAYHLYVHAEDGSSGARAHTRLRLVVQ